MFKCKQCKRTVEWYYVPGHYDPCKQCGRYVYDASIPSVGEVVNTDVCKTSTAGSNPAQKFGEDLED